MKTRTRLFMVVAVGILVAGLGTGLVASYVGGFQNLALIGTDGPESLQYIPRDAQMVAFANVREVMDSELRQKFSQLHPNNADGFRGFTEATGVNPETDIDEVLATFSTGDLPPQGPPLVVARGRFDEVRIEGMVRREAEAQVEEYRGKRLLTFKEGNQKTAALAFVEPGVIVFGSDTTVRRALDTKATGNNVTANSEVMRLIRDVQTGDAWTVVRLDTVAGQANLPREIAERIPAITWFSASGNVDGGVSGKVTAEAKDEASAQNLRDVIRGFMALARMQTGGRADIQQLVDSLQLGGQGNAVTVDFNVPAEVFDALAALRPFRPSGPGPFLAPNAPEPPAPPAPPEPPAI